MNPLRPALHAALSLPPTLRDRLAGTPPTIDGHTLDPAVNMLLHLAARVSGERPHEVGPRRADMVKNSTLVMPRPRAVQASPHLIAGRLRARVYRARNLVGQAPVVMYLHGGGWVVGDLDSHDGTCRMLALHSGCIVVSIEYRLAPEHPFPAGLDDAVEAFHYIQQNHHEFGGVPGVVAVAGDSAGGNLAAALCLQADPLPTALALIYPATDLRMCQPSIETFKTGFFLTREDMFWYRELYLPDVALATDPRVSPLLADDLSTFPPTGVWTAGFDPLRDEGMAFAQRLEEFGVSVRHRCLGDQIHGFFGMGVLPGGMDRIAGVSAEVGDLVRSAMA